MMQDTFLYDGGKKVIQCSNCKKALAEIWVMRPNMPVKSRVRATCPFCGDKSFIVEVDGQFSLGHVDGVVMTNNELQECREKDGIFYQDVLITTQIRE